jgi:hypothetical protein
MKFLDYIIELTPSGEIILDRELTPDLLNVEQGDLFEAIIVPDVGVVLKKVNKSVKNET